MTMPHSLSDIRTKIITAKGKLLSAKEVLAKSQKRLDAVLINKDHTEKALIVAQNAGEMTLNQICVRVNGSTTSAIKTVLPVDYEYHLDFGIKRGTIDADQYLLDPDENRLNPLDDNGGGVVDAVAMALRIICLVVNKKEKRRTVFLDEPFISVSKEFQENAGKLLKALSQQFGIQFICVSHETSIMQYADKLFVTDCSGEKMEELTRLGEQYDIPIQLLTNSAPTRRA